jgi:hypothetical protein
MAGNNGWIKEAIEDSLCVVVTDGSYIKQVYLELFANAFIMECSRGCERMMGSFAEDSSSANAYGGEMLSGSYRCTSLFLLYSAWLWHWRVKLSSTPIALEL